MTMRETQVLVATGHHMDPGPHDAAPKSVKTKNREGTVPRKMLSFWHIPH